MRYYFDSPSETDTTGVAHAVTQNLAGEDLIGGEDCDKLLLPMSVRDQSWGWTPGRTTYSLGDRLGQVGDVQVGGAVITLSLEAGVEALASEANLVTQEVEALDALLRVTDVLELGKAETVVWCGCVSIRNISGW